MALTTKTKSKSAFSKKRQAQHHRQSKRYLKAYSPYLPVFGIIGLGVLIDRAWSAGDLRAATALNSPSETVTTRLATVTGNSSNVLLDIVLALTFIAFAVYVVTHWYRFHRMLNRGEAFVAKHPWLDLSLVLVVTVGVVLTRVHV